MQMYYSGCALVLVAVILNVGSADYKNCPRYDNDKLNVHLVAHTHDDVGWLKTVDQYFYGDRNDIQNAGVQYILNSVISQLVTDETKRFIYVETAFFWRWWNEQHDHVRHIVRKLVKKGQLEFIGGGWSMEDEACTHYSAIIENMAWGLRRLNDTFGPSGRPLVAWQIDPFGHSREQASLFAQMGYDGLFFGRLDYMDKIKRQLTKNMEIVWKGSSNLGDAAWLFTGALPNGYGPPPGFDFDVFSRDSPIMDDKRLEGYNVDEKVSRFLHAARKEALFYATNHIIMTMGEDFNYQSAQTWYFNLDKLIKYVNAVNGSGVNVFYSTPSCYLKALHSTGTRWKTKMDDFFPYSSDPHAYWTGYYTSRPALKKYARIGNNFLQACGQLSALTNRLHEPVGGLVQLRETIGVLQHHDAVSGTSKQHVANDYAKRLYNGMQACQPTISDSFNALMKKDRSEPLVWEHCYSLNTSSCSFSETQSRFLVSVHNPLAHPRSTVVRIPVVLANYSVTDGQGNILPTELHPISQYVLRLPGRKSIATHELVFSAKMLPPLGFRVYYIQKEAGFAAPLKRLRLRSKARLENDMLKLDIDEGTGLMRSLTYGDTTVSVKQRFGYYLSMAGNNVRFNDRASGAYVFRPNGTHPYMHPKANKVSILKGKFYSEIEQEFSDWISQRIRVYADQDYAELDWIVGPIPIKDGMGKEVITSFESTLESGHYFWTDSNGRELLARKRDYRPTWKLNVTEPVAGNYYPINSHIKIVDYSDREMAVLVDRAQGGSSMKSGQIELMVHRRCLHDDAFGVGEALNETAFGVGLVVRGQHRLVVGKQDDSAETQRITAKHMYNQPMMHFAAVTMTSDEWIKTFINELSGIREALPKNVHVLTLTPWRGDQLLLRLEHFFEKNESSKLSLSVKVSLKNLFSPWKISKIEELTLGANQLLKDSHRLKWNVQDEQLKGSPARGIKSSDFIIQLDPMQICTFVISVTQ